jgi:signal transduction histidine kinase
VAKLGGYRAIIVIPMMREDELVGIFSLARPEPEPFTPGQIKLVQTFADQAAIAVENARLFNETKEALERQTATAGILKVIASSPSDTQPVFEAIVRSANILIGGFSSTVFRFIDGVGHLKAFTPTTPAADEVLRATFPLPISDFLPFQMARAGEATQVADTETLSNEILDIARARGFRSIMFAPMMSDGVSIGSIAVTRAQPGTFADHHVQLLQTFADQAVIAIENVRLFEQVQAKTRDLSESLAQQTATADVLKVISRSAFDLKSVLTTLTESAQSLCGASLGIICLRDGEVMRLRAESGCTQAFIDFMEANPIRRGRATITGRVFMDGKPVHVADVQHDPEYNFGQAPTIGAYRAVLAVPLMRDGAVEGVLLLGRPDPGPFSQRQIDLVQTFADQAVIAIENVRLFDEVQTRTRELSASLDELRTAQDRLVQTEKLASLGQLTAGIAHEIKNPLNFVNNFSALSAELIDELNDALKPPVALDDKVREEIDELTQMLKGNLEKVVQHGKRADSIVKNMLLHSREGAGEQRSADINAIVEESLNLAYHGARAEKPGFNITLRRDLDPAAGMIDLYPQEMTRVFLNLISNGFYAAAKRKEAGDEGFEPTLSATTKSLGNKVEIRIRDNGTGIPPQVRERMFDPFFTTKPAGEGTGLGLSMSHDIVVKQHGGKIEVDTMPGAFTEFIITLPRAAAAQQQAGGTN